MRNRFKLIVHESVGQAYEDLFVKIMTYADMNFRPVKAHGNIGDRGNDGWNSVNGRYYQSYAPEELPANSEKAIKKLKEDFFKLKAYWDSISPVREFIFVLNDKFKGISPHITKAIQEIKSEYNLCHAEVMIASDLERLIFDLDEDQIVQILGAEKKVEPSCNNNELYEYLVNTITEKLYLTDWIRISDNLIANGIDDFVIEGFTGFTTIVFRTNFPKYNSDLEEAIIELSNRVQALVNHFTKSKHAYITENLTWWVQDLRWKQTRHTQEVYEAKYNESDQWRQSLYKLHVNLVHALNLYAFEVKKSVNSSYFMNQSFVLSDSLGTYNNMEGYQYIPTDFVEVN